MAKHTAKSGHLTSKSTCSPRKEIEIIYKGLAMEDKFSFTRAREKQHSPTRVRTKQAVPRISDFAFPTVANAATSGPLDTTEDFEKPQLLREPAFNMRASETAPYIVTSNSIHIYTENRSQTHVFQHVCDMFPEIWQDIEPSDLSSEKMMKVPLIDSYQNYKLSSHPYPFNHHDKMVLDKCHNILHIQGHIEWIDQPILFATPCFVIWRTVHSEEKGYVVIDLHNLNHIVIPDNYPLPLQRDIIEAIRGKGYFTIIDITSFFFQFLVHPNHRDHFTIISHRGFERSTITLMDFWNSPAYMQRFMDQLLRNLKHFYRAFINNIVIFSDTFEDHC